MHLEIRVDECDADLLGGVFHLSSSGDRKYVKLSGKVYLHRAIAERMIGGPLGRQVVDHMNGDSLDNRRANLRVVSHMENIRNRTKLNKNNTSGHMGVRFKVERQRWQAYIMLPAAGGSRQKMKHLGYFEKQEDAIQARLAAEVAVWGVQPFRLKAFRLP